MQTWKKAGMLLCFAGVLAGCQCQKAEMGNVSVTKVVVKGECEISVGDTRV